MAWVSQPIEPLAVPSDLHAARFARRSALRPRSISSSASVVLACAAAGAFLLVALSGVIDTESVRVLSDVTIVVLPFAAAAACGLAACRHRGRGRLAWALIAAGLVSWGTGEALWLIIELVLHRSPFPSVADVGYLAGFPLAAAGIVLFPVVREQGRHSPLRSLLDALLVSVSVFLVGWVTVLHPLIEASSGRMIDQVISLAYPLCDVALVAVVVFVSGNPMRDREMPLMLLGLGFLGMAVADFGFAYLELTDSYVSGHPIDAGWIWSYVLLGLAAFAPSARHRWACSWMAATTFGCEWPVEQTAIPAAKSRNRLPSTSVTVAPDPDAATSG
jgi:hypothetical protein